MEELLHLAFFPGQVKNLLGKAELLLAIAKSLGKLRLCLVDCFENQSVEIVEIPHSVRVQTHCALEHLLIRTMLLVLDEVHGDMRANGSVKATHELVEKRLLVAGLLHVDTSKLVDHAVVPVNGLPDLRPVEGCIGLFILQNVNEDRSLICVLILIAPRVLAQRVPLADEAHLRGNLRELTFDMPYSLGFLSPVQIGTHLNRVESFDPALARRAHPLLSPEGALVVHVHFEDAEELRGLRYS